MDCDVAVIGAGAAGLSATATLKKAGLDVRCLEAGGRVGGRILTIHDPLAPLPVELGAEFVHGRPPETWNWIRDANLTVFEHTPQALHFDRGRILQEVEVGEFGDRVLSQMTKSSRRKDESFEEYLKHSHQPASVKNWARVHIEGFNASRRELISAESLQQDSEAADQIEGDRSFRLLGGYDSLVLAMLRSIPEHPLVIQLNSPVNRIKWRRGLVEARYGERELRCRQVIVTVPLGVLQGGAIGFDPEPRATLRAASKLRFGQVYRITFRFQEAFWEEREKLKRAGFLISQDKRFSAWWTTHPVVAPLITGWMAGSRADDFRISSPDRVAAEALKSLARILGHPVPRPAAFYFHNWRTDPLFRGAYSYVPVNALSAREVLAQPLEETLYFAGEATELKGHSATVHGAIASGIRTANLVLAARARRKPAGRTSA